MLTVMLTGPLILTIGGPPLVLLFFLDPISFLGGPRNSLWWLDPAQRQNTDAWLLLQQRSLGFNPCCLNFKLLMLHLSFSDNTSTVSLAHNPVLHSRTKHMELDLFFVREKVLNKKLDVVHVPAMDQIADVATKALSPSSFISFRSKLKVVERPSSNHSWACRGV